jgi:hypothetical protein
MNMLHRELHGDCSEGHSYPPASGPAAPTVSPPLEAKRPAAPGGLLQGVVGDSYLAAGVSVDSDHRLHLRRLRNHEGPAIDRRRQSWHGAIDRYVDDGALQAVLYGDGQRSRVSAGRRRKLGGGAAVMPMPDPYPPQPRLTTRTRIPTNNDFTNTSQIRSRNKAAYLPSPTSV